MRALLAAAALLSLALAGCSGGDPDPAPPGPGGAPGSGSGSATSTSTAPPVPASDTLHFLAAPEMAPRLPAGGPEHVTPVGVGDFGQQGGPEPEGAEWAHAVGAATNVTAGEVRLWINIKETMYENPGSVAQQQCTWRLTAAIGGDLEPIQQCINEPLGPIQPGIKELVFNLAFESPIELEVGETVTVRLDRAAFSLSPNNAVDALSGTPDHDSRITLRGLREPAPP